LRRGPWRVVGDGAGRDDVVVREADGALQVALAPRGGFVARAAG
jgi:hypothetical protein